MQHSLHFPILKEIGLNENEALVYQILLELGPKPAQELVEPSGLSRGNLYNTLNSMKYKGVVSEEVGTKTIYTAVDPETLRTLAKTNVLEAQETLNQLESTLPSLKSAFRLITKKPLFRVFEGVEGIKKIYSEILAEDKPIYSLIGPDAPAPELYTWLRSSYLKKRVSAKIHVYAIASGGRKASTLEQEAEQELRTIINLPAEQFNFEGEVTVFGNNIAFINYKETELVGLILESTSLANTLRSAIKALLEYAPKD